MEKGLILTTKKNAVVLVRDRGGAKTTFRYYGPSDDRIKGGMTMAEFEKLWMPTPTQTN